MSTLNNCNRKIEIVGLIPSIPYQTAIRCATEIARYYPRFFTKPKVRGMLEFDWDEYVTKQSRKFGGQLWALLRPVAVYIDNEFIGSDEDLLEIVNSKFSYSLSNCNSVNQQAMLDDYTRYLAKSERLYVYLDINIAGEHIGHLIFQLYSDLLPATSYNFRCLCTGEERKELCYKGTQIHRIAKMGWIQGGDNENITGGGGKSIYGATFADESYCISHDRRGVLSMANDGKHTNSSQFFVTLQPTLWMDYYYVAFGQLVEGVEVLKAIEAVEDRYEEPMKCIKIIDCGIVYEPTSKAYRKKMWPYKSEEIRRNSMEDRERKKMEKEEKDRKAREESESLLEEPRLAEELLDPRELDSNMHVDRYLAGFYYLFDGPPRKLKDEEGETEGNKPCENVVDHIGRYILETLLKTVDLRMNSEETNESMVRRVVSEIVTKATIHLEVESASELVEYVIAKAIETITFMYKEESDDDEPNMDQLESVREETDDQYEDGDDDFQDVEGKEVVEGSEQPVEEVNPENDVNAEQNEEHALQVVEGSEQTVKEVDTENDVNYENVEQIEEQALQLETENEVEETV